MATHPAEKPLSYYDDYELEEHAWEIGKNMYDDPEYIFSLFKEDNDPALIRSYFTFLDQLEPEELFERHVKCRRLKSYEDMINTFSSWMKYCKTVHPYEKACYFYAACLKLFLHF